MLGYLINNPNISPGQFFPALKGRWGGERFYIYIQEYLGLFLNPWETLGLYFLYGGTMRN